MMRSSLWMTAFAAEMLSRFVIISSMRAVEPASKSLSTRLAAHNLSVPFGYRYPIGPLEKERLK